MDSEQETVHFEAWSARQLEIIADHLGTEETKMRTCPLTKHNWQMVCIQCGKVRKDGYVRIPFKDFEAMMKEPAFQEIYNNVRDRCEPYSWDVDNQEVERDNVS